MEEAERILSPPSEVQFAMLEALTFHTERFAGTLAHLQAGMAVGGSFVQTIPVGTNPGDPPGFPITAAHGAQPLVPKIIA